MNLKKYEEAARDFTKAIELQPNLAEAYYNRGVMAYDTGKKAEGCVDLQKASGLGLQSAADEYNKLCH
jgi:tetratricopeptide (TPR) repeat protein